MKRIDCFIDGACEPVNPGGTGSYGIYAVCNGEVVLEDWAIIGTGEGMTNNVAEYRALFHALLKLKEKFGTKIKIVIHSDSQLVVKQCNDEWPIRRGHYVEMAQRARHVALEFPRITYVWIPREKNGFADALSKRALAEKGIKPHYSRR